MDIRLDKIVIVDLEATCWEDHQVPPGQQSEVIELGVCLFDTASGQLTDKQSILVRPERSSVSPFCTHLTGLTQQQVNTGMAFADACLLLQDTYATHERVWASWGNYDRSMLQGQCADSHVPYPFGDLHINIKQLFANLNGGQHRDMQGALDEVGLSLQGRPHSGADDAWNIGRLLGDMFERFGPEVLLSYSDIE